MRWASISLALLLLVPAGTLAGPTPYAVNPSDTDAVVFGTLRVRPTPGRAPLNLGILAADPANPEDDTFWCVSNATAKRCCFRTGGKNYCWAGDQTPTATRTITPTITPYPAGGVQYVPNTMSPTPTATPTATPTLTPTP